MFSHKDALLCYTHELDSPSFLSHTSLYRVSFSEQSEAIVMPRTWPDSECILEEELTSSGLHGRERQLQPSLQKDRSKGAGGELLSQTGLKKKKPH